MDKNPETLLRGREFEREVFGDWVSDSDVLYDRYGPPERIDRESSIQQEIILNWKRAELSRELGKGFYDPSNPQTGQSRRVWLAIKSYLASQSKEWGREPIFLYPTMGRNALDCWYGVDAVVWWYGVSVTIDLTTSKTQLKEETFKADVLLTRRDLASQKNLSAFGRMVAELLIARKLAGERNVVPRAGQM